MSLPSGIHFPDATGFDPPPEPHPICARSHAHRDEARQRQPLEIGLLVPHGRGNPMRQASAAHNAHLGAAEGGAVRGWDKRLRELRCREVVGPAAEKGEGEEGEKDEDEDGMRDKRGGRRREGRVGQVEVEVEEGEYHGDLVVVMSTAGYHGPSLGGDDEPGSRIESISPIMQL